MKILYLTNSFPNRESAYDGIFNYRRVKNLLDKGIAVEVVNYNSALQKKGLDLKSGYNLRSIGLDADLDVTVVNYINAPLLRDHLPKKIVKIFYEKKTDLIHSHFIWNGYLCRRIKEKYGIPYVLTVHGSDVHTEPFENDKKRSIALDALNGADKNIFVSNYLLKKAQEFGYTKTNHMVIPNGIDTDEFRIIPADKNKFNIRTKAEEKTVGFVGGLDPVKRVFLLPEIFSLIAQKYDNVRFLIVGDGVLRKEIETNIEKQGIKDRLIITGNVNPSDVPHHINNMDVLLLPSEKEGFPCVVLESFACGVPVVGSNNGGIPEAVGDCGILVDDGENFSERFASSVVEILKNGYDKKKLTDRAFLYKWDKIIDSEINVYSEILKDQP